MFLRCLILFCLTASWAWPQSVFPGLQEVLTEAEWERAGLHRLTPDQIGVIDAALIRHTRSREQHLQRELDQARTTTASAASTTASPPGVPARRSAWERFGFARDRDQPAWRDIPPMRAHVTAWQAANRFVLDNGQVWEGVEPIPYELKGREVAIEARPANNFALTVEGQPTPLRVRRVK